MTVDVAGNVRILRTRPLGTATNFLCGSAIRLLLKDPRGSGGGGGGSLGPWPARADPPTHAHQKIFPEAKNEIY